MLVAIAALFFVILIKVASLAARAKAALSSPWTETKEVTDMEKTNLNSTKRLSLLSHATLESLWAVVEGGTAGVLST